MSSEFESLFTRGKWGEYENFSCSLCPYSVIGVEHIEAHIREAHATPQQRPIEAKLFDSRGREIETIDETEG